MHYFHYKGDELFCEEKEITEISKAVGTPFYLYSRRTLLRHCENIHKAFGDLKHLTCYSVKANSNIALLNILAEQGIGVDIVSGGELFRALKAGFPPGKIVYSGVGKTDAEIEYALKEGILAFNAESFQEIERINQIAGKLDRTAPMAVRVNPDIDPKTHPHIATGLKENKFGISYSEVREAYKRIESLKNLKSVGIDAHIGSQITELSPFIESIEKLLELVWTLRKDGINIEHIDIGGGLGIRYDKETPPEPSEWAEAIIPMLKESGCRIIFEPGRSLMGNAGILVTKVLYLKETEGKLFIIVDAGMNDLIRPALYDSYHQIIPVVKSGSQVCIADIVGPICETSGFLAKDRSIQLPEPGDLLAVMSAGAYGFSMSSNYNSRPRCSEVLVSGEDFEIIRERETYENLIRGEKGSK